MSEVDSSPPALEAEAERLQSVNAQLLTFMREILANIHNPERMTHTQAVGYLQKIEIGLRVAIKEAEKKS